MNAKPSRRPATSNARTRKMRAVLAACRRLGLDEDVRKDLQEEITGVSSMADMTERQLGELLDHLNRDYRGTNPDRAHIAKIKALWWSLYWLGAIDEPADRALSAFVKRQTGIAALRFLDHRSAPAVIEALKSWLAREGVAWPDRSAESASADRWAVIAAILQRLRLNGRHELTSDNSLAWRLDLPLDRRAWTARQLDDVICYLGKRWRAAKP